MYTTTQESGNYTSLKGYFRTSYQQLVELFGDPNSEGDGYKVSTKR